MSMMPPIGFRDMPRNLDLAALRALVTIADFGGVTRAAGVLNLTQSAVSMQVRRLEEALGQPLLDRTGRGVTPNATGEHLIAQARRILALNDEIVARLTAPDAAGDITVHVPHDMVYPHVPRILRHFAGLWPRMRVSLVVENTHRALKALEAGETDLIVTTETGCGARGETLARLQLLWFGTAGGEAWRTRPLPLAQSRTCAFRPGIIAALDRAGIPWITAIDSESDRTIEAAVSSDMAVSALLDGTAPPSFEPVAPGSLPTLGQFNVNLYLRPGASDPALVALADLFRRAWGGARPDVAGLATAAA
jgi:DNA-binding transcriptional LysR family regulator